MKLKVAVIVLSILAVLQFILFVSSILYYNDKNFKKFVDENIFGKRQDRSSRLAEGSTKINDIYFYKTLGGKENENVYSFKITNDRIFITGNRENKNRTELLLLSLDSSGNLYEELYLGRGNTNFEGTTLAIFQSNILVAGDLTVESNSDIYLVLISNSLPIWDIVIGSERNEISPVVSTLRDGKVVIAFGTKALNSDAYELAFTVMNKKGDIKDISVIRGGVKDLPTAILEVSNKVWIIGETKTFGFGASDILIVSLSNYFIEWVKVIGSKDFESPMSAISVDDGVLISVNSPRFSVLKVDFDGNIKWVKRYRNGNVTAMTQVSNKILSIGPIANPYSINNLFILETDTEFNPTVEEFYSFNYNELPVGVWSDGTYTYIVGTSHFEATKNDIWIAKLKKMTNIESVEVQTNVELVTNLILSVSNINVEVTNFIVSYTNQYPFYLYSISGLPDALSERFEKEKELKKLMEKKGKKKKKK
jgi:hypothetical protein